MHISKLVLSVFVSQFSHCGGEKYIPFGLIWSIKVLALGVYVKLIKLFPFWSSFSVGTLLGAVTGALIGHKTESGFIWGAAVGAFSGAVFSIEVFESSLVLWKSNESRFGCLLCLVRAEILSLILWNHSFAKLESHKVCSFFYCCDNPFQVSCFVAVTRVSYWMKSCFY